jgi:hypothetical protein
VVGWPWKYLQPIMQRRYVEARPTNVCGTAYERLQKIPVEFPAIAALEVLRERGAFICDLPTAAPSSSPTGGSASTQQSPSLQ